jgi:hypothetical protein
MTGEQNEFLIHPVPADGYMIISSEVSSSITVHSADGRVVERFSVAAGEFMLDTSRYPSGTYHLVQDQQHQRFSQRFVVMH